MLSLIANPKTGDVLLITKSQKDVMLAYELGIPAIAPCSEVLFLSNKQIQHLKKRFKTIVVCYDTDITGIHNLKQIKVKVRWCYIWKKYELIDLTFSQVLDKMVEEFPDQYAFKYTTLDYTRTYSEFRDDVDEFARSLISMGVKAGTHVAVWASNVPQWYLAFWATVKIGAVLVTVNTAYKIHEAEYLLRQSDTHTLVMIDSCKDSNYKEIIEELCPELKTLKKGQPLYSKKLPFLKKNGC